MFIQSYSPFTLLLLAAFSLLRAAHLHDFWIKALAASDSLTVDTFRLIDLISMVTGCDFHRFKNQLVQKLLSVVFHQDFPRDRQPYLDFAIDFISFQPVFDQSHPKPTLDLSNLLSDLAKPEIKLPPYRCSFKMFDDRWADLTIVHQVQNALLLHVTGLKLDRFMIPFGLSLHPMLSLPGQSFDMLEYFSSTIPEESQYWTPILVYASRISTRFSHSATFMKRFGSRLHYSGALVKAYSRIMANFKPSVISCSQIDVQVQQLLRTDPNYIPMQTGQSDVLLATGMVSPVDKRAESSWKRLSDVLFYDGSPFASSDEPRVFRRGTRFDRHFRPSLAVSSTFGGGVIVQQVVLWSKNCERLELERTSEGRFEVTKVGYCFVAKNCDEAVLIMGTIVTHVFWGPPEQVQIFTIDYRCYLFRFPGEQSHDFVQQLKRINLSNIVFFQAGPPDVEIQKQNLTQSWRTHQLTTFNYVMWLNLLAGRSFLNAANYPVFPVLFDRNGEPRNFSRFCPIEVKTNNEGIRCLFESPRELVPEFFFSDDFLSEIELPVSPCEFIAKHCEALESENTNRHICHWFDRIWGIQSALGLFKKPHPARNSLTIQTDTQPRTLRSTGPTLNCRAFGTSFSNLKIITLAEAGQVVELKFGSGPVGITHLTGVLKVSLFVNTAIVWANTNVAQVDLQNKSTIIFPGFPHVAPVSGIVSYGDLIVTAAEDGCLAAWRSGRQDVAFVGLLIAHAAPITSLCASVEFGIIASCGLDDRVVVTLLPAWKVLRSFRMNLCQGMSAKKVVVTDSLGFFVINAEGRGKHILMNFTLNGRLVNMVELQAETVDFCAVVGKKGTDRICLVNAAGQVLLINAFSFEEIRVITVRTAPHTIQYCESMKALIITDNDGTVSVFPFECA
jgi:hypothetical protein